MDGSGPLSGPLGAALGIFDVLGASVGGLGSLSGPLWAVLDRYGGLGERSWATIGALRAVLGRSWGIC